MNARAAPITALLVAPDRALAAEFGQAAARSRAFEVLAELKTYPVRSLLEMRLRQLRPEVVLVDLATDVEQGLALVRTVVSEWREASAIGLHSRNDSDAILRSLRLGAIEFLYAPFDPEVQRQAVARIRRLRDPQPQLEREPGKVIVFTSAKPGSGASTLAAQVALALCRIGGRRVLLADLDGMDATLSFYLRLRPARSLLERLAEGTPVDFAACVERAGALDALGAPALPVAEAAEPPRLGEFLERARQLYDRVILDLPPVFHRLALLALPESDAAFLVSTAELPSLHLARKAVAMLSGIGFGPDRYRLIVNRVGKGGLKPADVAKVVNSPVCASFPNDYFAVERAVAAGRPLAGDTELGRAVERFARELAGAQEGEKRRGAAVAMRLAASLI